MVDAEAFEAGRKLHQQMMPQFKDTPLRDGGFADEMRALSQELLFGKIWTRPGLDLRSRSLVTLGILIALRAEYELELHFGIALRNGLTREELAEVIYHSTGYAGYPAAAAARACARKALDNAVDAVAQDSSQK